MLLAAEQGLNYTAIARHFGITKGAVSQTMSRLQQKGVIQVCKNREARNAASVQLTDLGEDLIAGVHSIRFRLAPAVNATLVDLAPAELHGVDLFLERLEMVFSRELDRQRSS